MGRRGARLGQHFLTDERVVQRAVGYAELTGSETVLEIGPGKGVLTRALAEAAREVVAVELDRELAAGLEAWAPGNVRVVRGDAVDVALPPFDKCVSNLPYQISSPVTFRLLDMGFEVAVLMYQKEFADRLVASPGSKAYGRLSVTAAYRAEAEVLERVPPGAFSPPPRVQSAIVRLTPRPPGFEVEDEALFLSVVRAAFAHRRKTLANAVAAGAHMLGAGASEAVVKAAMADAPHGGKRPGKLAPEAFAEVARHLRARGVSSVVP